MKKVRRDIKRNESGLTLIEVIASIVILSIVLISFASLFLQSTKHTKYNKEKLMAVEVAELVIADLRMYQKLESLVGYNRVDHQPTETTYVNEIIAPNYKVEVKVKPGPSEVKLKKAVVSVEANAETASKKSSFITEMYFEEEESS